MPDPADDLLADRVRRRDGAALALYLDGHRPALLSFVERRLGSALRGKLEPQDVIQELAVKALRELPNTDLTGREPFGWLCHLAEQCIVDGHRHFSAGKRATAREQPGNTGAGEASQDFIAMLAASITSPTQAVVRNERQSRIAEAMAGLPEDQREALRLRYVEGLSTRDVAGRLKKSEVATRVMLSRVVQKLQDLLAEEG